MRDVVPVGRDERVKALGDRIFIEEHFCISFVLHCFLVLVIFMFLCIHKVDIYVLRDAREESLPGVTNSLRSK